MLEKELESRKLPDLFVLPNGQKIETAEDWGKIARPYWREMILKEEYGKLPPVVQPTVETKTNVIDFAGKAVWETVKFTFEVNGKTHTIPTQLVYPKNAENIPFFLFINFHTEIFNRFYPVEELIDQGVGVFSVCHNDITKDNGDFSDGIAGLFQDGERTGDDAGKIAYWSYTLSRMLDYLLTRKEADKTRIGVTGHSRLGKTALLTAALDERFAFTCSNNSGCSGAALARGRNEEGESIEYICRTFPHWFCPNHLKYANDVESMPFDQHCVLALIAPRKAYIGAALEDVWADTDSQYLNCVASTKAWNLYGKEGFIAPDRLPVCGDVFTDGEVGFHLRAGKHFYSRADWQVYVNAVKK